MTVLMDYDSDGHPKCEDATPGPPDDAQRRPQVLPDIDTIIQETRDDLSQTRLKADKLICDFAYAYIANAEQLREIAIERYRQRLEGLPGKDRAKVCEALAKDEIVCCDMEFGNGNLSHGGMSFSYKAESDAAFNALSHHKWKDLHETFVKDNSHSPSGNALENRRLSQAPLVHSSDDDDEEDELQPNKDSPNSSSELSELSSDHGGSLPCGVRNGEKYRNSFSPSPDWVAGDQSRSSSTPKERGPDRPSRQDGQDVSKTQVPGRTPNGPWSEEEEAVIRETMKLHLLEHGHLGYTRRATMNLEKVLHRRTTAAIKNKWLSLRTKEVWDEWTRTSGKAQVGDSDSLMELDDDNDDELGDREGRRGLHDMNSGKKTRNMVPVAPQEERQAPEASSRLPYSKRPEQSEAAEASELRRKIRPSKEPHAQLWSPQEIEILTTLTKGFTKLEEIDFKRIAAQLPDPSRRSEKACRSFWVRRVEPSQLSREKDPKHGSEAPAKSLDSNRNLGLQKSSSKIEKRRQDAVISVARRPKHARGSSNEDEKRFGTGRKRHGGARAQSFPRRRDHDYGSEAEDPDVCMYDFE